MEASFKEKLPEIELETATIARRIAQDFYESTGYRFIYKRYRNSRSTSDIQTFAFFCAQNEREKTKQRLNDDVKKRRNRMEMKRYECKGYLYVTLNKGSLTESRIRLSHHLAHDAYVSIGIPENHKDLIKQLKSWTPSKLIGLKIWDRILETDPETELTEKQVHAEWQ
ncbi:hypothetical protein MPER_06887 [Moniliophthora perniciosa FA553]|nr:hypothetical protein MPER_06887 [Moniliophthora perniciosa FA553]